MDEERFSKGMFRRVDATATKYEGGISEYILESKGWDDDLKMIFISHWLNNMIILEIS